MLLPVSNILCKNLLLSFSSNSFSGLIIYIYLLYIMFYSNKSVKLTGWSFDITGAPSTDFTYTLIYLFFLCLFLPIIYGVVFSTIGQLLVTLSLP